MGDRGKGWVVAALDLLSRGKARGKRRRLDCNPDAQTLIVFLLCFVCILLAETRPTVKMILAALFQLSQEQEEARDTTTHSPAVLRPRSEVVSKQR